MAPNEEPTFDLDALQAQINMAMAETEELVSTWVRPSKKTRQRPKQSFEDMEKELQEYLRRPPRLGVGAPIPEPIGPNAQEEARLKDKLVGHDKKRRREDGAAKKSEEELDEEDGRKGESSTKKVRLDPFSVPKKKAKHKEDEQRAEARLDTCIEQTDNSTFVPAEDGVLTNGVTPHDAPTQAEVVSDGPPNPQTSGDIPASPISTKKKKKKRKLGLPNGIMDNVSDPSVINGSVVRVIPDAKSPTSVTADEDNNEEEEEEEWTGFGDLTLDPVDTGYSLDEEDVDSQIKANGISPKNEPGSSLAQMPRTGAPLLNLNGPPHSDNDDAVLSPSSKKRRRRKKNKMHGMENKS